MNKKFRLVLIVLFIGSGLFSCVKRQGKKELEDNLKAAMGVYLNHRPGIDTSRVQFTVLEVVYYDDKKDYICDFKVHMKEKTPDQIKDTTGTMRARISRDFKDVTRSY
ncbi:MAG TPA: hypothetical protein DIC22_09205 [Chitinophagaceae bacterium]|jgi:hypothetical protein|nr:hypothetical protein [Chitinophagaceae bacterium]